MKKSNAGFSLVELMVVVAIIGILATIAVPNFQRFQAKALQSNAKVELAGVYTAQKAFYTEYQTYHANLPAIGFLPEGFQPDALNDGGMQFAGGMRRYYSVSTFSGSATPVTLLSLNLPDMSTWLGIYPASNAQTVSVPGSNGLIPTLCPFAGGNAPIQSVTPPLFTQVAFTVTAHGCPKSSAQVASNVDVWFIDQNKNLQNTQSGI